MNQKQPHKGEGHRKRLRDKFLSSGLSGFHDYEVIELLLTLGTPRKDCKEPAKAALKHFKTLQGVLDASTAELCEVYGIGPNNLFGIKLVKAVADRYLEKRILHKDPIHNSKALFEFLFHKMKGGDRECFVVLYLDSKNRVIETETLFEGTLTASSVYPREVVKAAMARHAAALIFAHNHPSGVCDPSEEDIMLTRHLILACKIVGITVHEHIIIGDSVYFSFADQGIMARMNRDADALLNKHE